EIEGVRVANTMAWDKDDATARALRAYRSAVNKDVESLIAKDAGDPALFAATPTGEAMRVLKTFALASWQRLLLRRLDEKASRFMGGLIAMTAMGMFAALMQARAGNRTDELEHFAADPGSLIGAGFDRAGIMAVPLELSDAFEKATGFNP